MNQNLDCFQVYICCSFIFGVYGIDVVDLFL